MLMSPALAAAVPPDTAFIRPSGASGDRPVWGVRGGIAVGLWPTGGPRGLLRVYAPYLGQPDGRVFNFIAVEPVVAGRRDLSELQVSPADHKPGKPMWTADAVDLSHPPPFTAVPARGTVTRDGDASVLSVFVVVERFDNGAEPVVRITLRSDRPHEVELQTFSTAGGAPMSSCVLTATMGNWARLRHLQLRDRTVEAADLYRDKRLNDFGFYDWSEWPAADLPLAVGQRSASATGDADPVPEPVDVPPGWRYAGRPAMQSWSTADRPSLAVRVNGRSTFWATHAAVPGGPAFENFELSAPFEAGQSFRFSVTPR
jgi:hypothetical protein